LERKDGPCRILGDTDEDAILPRLNSHLAARYTGSVLWHRQRHTPAIPHLQKQGTATQLIVDDKPFLVLGGEFDYSRVVGQIGEAESNNMRLIFL
jgi:hypothetical protein